MTSVEEIIDAATAEGYLTPAAAMEGSAHSAGFLAFSDLPRSDDPQVGAVDLGTGGGVPGLVLATRTAWRWTLVERGERRTTFLRWAVRKLGLDDRVEVLHADAVEVARGPLRGCVDVVTARGFAPPALTAECAAPLLEIGGFLLVSEPPFQDDLVSSSSRWPVDGLADLGLRDVGNWRSEGATYRALCRVEECPDRFPRRFNRQADDPLWITDDDLS